jgi:hypothetical protein
MCVVDVLIHVDDNLNGSEKGELADRLLQTEGIAAPLHRSRKNHMLFVAYEPEKTNSLDVLAKVQALGDHAEIVAA